MAPKQGGQRQALSWEPLLMVLLQKNKKERDNFKSVLTIVLKVFQGIQVA